MKIAQKVWTWFLQNYVTNYYSIFCASILTYFMILWTICTYLVDFWLYFHYVHGKHEPLNFFKTSLKLKDLKVFDLGHTTFFHSGSFFAKLKLMSSWNVQAFVLPTSCPSHLLQLRQPMNHNFYLAFTAELVLTPQYRCKKKSFKTS